MRVRPGTADWCLPTSLCLHSVHRALTLLLGQSQLTEALSVSLNAELQSRKWELGYLELR